jgi:hypothetical protein
MGAKPDTGSALDANDRAAVTLVKVNDLNHTFLGTVAATGTFLAAEPDTAFRTGQQRISRAGGGAGSVQAAAANIGGKLRLQASSGPDLDSTVTGAVAFVNDAGTGQHTRIAADTPVHSMGLQNFARHVTTSFVLLTKAPQQTVQGGKDVIYFNAGQEIPFYD